MSFENWTIEDLFARCMDCDDITLEMDKEEFSALRRKIAMLQAGNSPVIPDGSASMLKRWLAFGRGMQNAGSQLPHNLIAETESMLAAAPQEVMKDEANNLSPK